MARPSVIRDEQGGKEWGREQFTKSVLYTLRRIHRRMDEEGYEPITTTHTIEEWEAWKREHTTKAQ